MIRQQFINEVRSSLKIRHRHQYRRPKRAGVLLPFILDDKEPRLVLTRRAETLSNHRGEVAFPGGMMDAQDTDITATALREAEEEIGLSSSCVTVIGQLDDLISRNEQVMVTPCIGVIKEPPSAWVANPDEVARVFEIPLALLYEKERWRIERREWKGRSFNLYFFDFDGETLWGLSAYATLLALDLTARRAPLDLSEYYHQIEQVRAVLKDKL